MIDSGDFRRSAATVSLSASSVLRGQRAVQLIGGVTLGIVIGSAVEHFAGNGALALGVAVLVSLAVAVAVGQGFFGQGLMFFNQAGASAVLVITLHRGGSGPQRLVDALIGGGVAVVVSVVLFPTAPGPIINKATRGVIVAIRDVVTQAAEVLASGSPGNERTSLPVSQRIHQQLAALDQALTSAQEIVRLAPRRWRLRPVVRHATERAERLDLLADSALSLLRVSIAAVHAGQKLPDRLAPAVGQLASILGALADSTATGRARTAADFGWAAESASAIDAASASITDVSAAGQTQTDLVAAVATACLRDLLRVLELGSP